MLVSANKNTLPSDINRSRISHAKIVGFSLLYCSIFETTAGVATFGLLPPIKPGGRNVPRNQNTKIVFLFQRVYARVWNALKLRKYARRRG